MDFNRLFPLSSLYFEPLSGRAVDSHVEHRRLGFVALARRHASHLVGLRSSSTVGNYLTALRSFSSFLGGTDVSLGAVTSRLVCGYARWLADRGVTRNTASCYLRSLRTLYRAVGSHARGGGNRPFADVFTGNVPTAKRAASVADMRRICSLRLPKGSRLQLAQDLFVFSFCAMGMPIRGPHGLMCGRLAMAYLLRPTGKSLGKLCCIPLGKRCAKVDDVTGAKVRRPSESILSARVSTWWVSARTSTITET
ncbi:MAG: phage integrase SAM-like domain-containing protein [Bacteroidales bacterium]|nr:phage integrase SAM-like domain-containing protein [Bacteroidales bacterium]